MKLKWQKTKDRAGKLKESGAGIIKAVMKNPKGALGLAIGGILTAIIVFFKGFASGFTDGLSKLLKFLKLDKLSKYFKGKSVKMATSMTGSITKFMTKFVKFFKPIAGLTTKLQPVIKAVSGIMKGIGKFGRILGRLFWPIQVIMGLWETVKGAMAGFSKFKDQGFLAGILGGLLGAVSGLVKFVIGWPLDLLKSAVTWIGEKMGFDMSFLKGFSFQDLIGDFYDNLTQGIIDGFNAIAEWFKGLPDKARSAVGAMGSWFSNLPEQFMNWIKGAVRAILPDPESDSWFGWAASKVIPDGIYKWAEYGKEPEKETKAAGEEVAETKGTSKAYEGVFKDSGTAAGGKDEYFDADGNKITDPATIAKMKKDTAWMDKPDSDFWNDNDDDWDDVSPNAKTTGGTTVTGGGVTISRSNFDAAAPRTAAEIAETKRIDAEMKATEDELMREIAADKKPIMIDQSVKSVNTQKKQVVVLKTRPVDQNTAQYGMKIG